MTDRSIPDSTVRMPPAVMLSTQSASDTNRFYHWFEKGPTPDGEAYRLPLPTEEGERKREINTLSALLRRARDRFNRTQAARSDQLVVRVKSVGNSMYVVIDKKYTSIERG